MAVPLSIGSVLILLGGLGLVMCLSAGIRRTPSPVHLLSMMAMAAFVALVGWSFVRVATRGFIREVGISDDTLVVVKVSGREQFRWAEINRLAATETGLNLRAASGAEIDLSPSLENFDDLVSLAKERYREAKQKAR